jgi:hypothetical protein
MVILAALRLVIFRIYARDGSSRAAHRQDVGNGEVGERLPASGCIVGIASSVSMLPQTLVVGADASVKIACDPRVLTEALTRFIGAAAPPEGHRRIRRAGFPRPGGRLPRGRS